MFGISSYGDPTSENKLRRSILVLLQKDGFGRCYVQSWLTKRKAFLVVKTLPPMAALRAKFVQLGLRKALTSGNELIC